MRLVEIQRQLKTKRRFRRGDYVVEVRLERPGDEAREFLRITVTEGDKVIASGLYKQLNKFAKWQPLSIKTDDYASRKKMQEMINEAAIEAGYLI